MLTTNKKSAILYTVSKKRYLLTTIVIQNMAEKITIRQMAERLHIGMSKAYQLKNQPGFPLVKIGRRYLIDTEKLEKWLENANEIQIG